MFTPERIAMLRELAREFATRYANGYAVYNQALSAAKALPAALAEIERLQRELTEGKAVILALAVACDEQGTTWQYVPGDVIDKLSDLLPTPPQEAE